MTVAIFYWGTASRAAVRPARQDNGMSMDSHLNFKLLFGCLCRNSHVSGHSLTKIIPENIHRQHHLPQLQMAACSQSFYKNMKLGDCTYQGDWRQVLPELRPHHTHIAMRPGHLQPRADVMLRLSTNAQRGIDRKLSRTLPHITRYRVPFFSVLAL